MRPRSIALLVATVPLLTLLLGCSLARPRPAAALFDLGPPPQLQDTAPLPRLVLAPVRSGPTIDSVEIRYRYASDPYRTRAYAQNRWLASPIELLERRIRASIDAHPLVETAAAAPTPTDELLAGHRLEVELEAFEQIFDTPSSARIELRFRATLFDGQTRAEIGRRLFARTAPTRTADAPGAVTALAEASDAAIAELLDWVREQASP